ncbi:TRAP transporter small permease subunit [Salipaludibacillus agaradhaerens]|uniref:TRAP transporter small permease n=1 Tax=Salipaludibacillus agaradhaerens TaxID=76935 RepID=UPI00215189B6|nr:TRAP transporter small permease subunit [Salipaludibacillus agaradhaerens]MCR6104907.1 TRAP transporter small permease subunit [Salipaludibacillus agaradhaerens]MCR6116954.1 TRAP transporter small permease subunit [Salipaludibacillus agaradhaerens]
MKKLKELISKVASAISIAMLITLALSLFIGVIARYVFSYSIPEIEVVRKFSVMWLVFMGSAIAVKEKLHLEIDILSDYMSDSHVRIKNMIVYVLVLFAISILIFIGVAAFNSGLSRSELVSIRFLSSPPSLIYYYSAFLVGSLFMLYFHLEQFKNVFSRKGVKKQ